jgi:DNA-3-methyladenine glycosylase I
MIAYHDTEWGVPVHDDNKLFEFLVLEAAQAGLSWETVLNKRENYRKAFADFNPKLVAEYTESNVTSLLTNAGIIRNRAKIESAILNARLFLNVQQEFGSFDSYIWRFVGGQPVINHFATLVEVPSKTSQSDAMSKDLKQRGFKFVGSTICYAFMQAVGMVNDHLQDCFRFKETR